MDFRTEAAAQQVSEDDEWCEANGHQSGCPHDPTDYDARNDDEKVF
jgi:hypothetical protein